MRHKNFFSLHSTEPNDTEYRPGSIKAATIQQGRVPYGEQSRKYRRTVFAHDDWVSHRNSSGRIFESLQSMLFSGIVRQLRPQVTTVAVVAACVILYNGIGVPYLASHLTGVPSLPLLVLPSLPFTLSSPALGLLLVFRTNASYARWLEARTTWGRISSQARNLIRMADTFSDDATAVQQLVNAVWLYCRSVMNRLSPPEDDDPLYQQDVRDVYPTDGDNDEFFTRILAASPEQRTMLAMKHLSRTLHALPVSNKFDPKVLIEADKSIVILGECTSICEKIYTSPVPLVYTRHTARFLSLWAVLLPVALYAPFGDIGMVLLTVPAASFVALFLFGIDELAMQLEEPFSILPMDSFCAQVALDTNVLCGSLQTEVK